MFIRRNSLRTALPDIRRATPHALEIKLGEYCTCQKAEEPVDYRLAGSTMDYDDGDDMV